MVQDYLRQTEQMFEAVNRDWQAAQSAGRVDAADSKNWAAFLASWRAFRKDASSLTGGTVDRAEDYRTQLKGWRDRLQRAGWKPASAPIPAAQPSAISKFSRDFAIALGIAGGTALILAMIKGAVRGR